MPKKPRNNPPGTSGTISRSIQETAILTFLAQDPYFRASPWRGIENPDTLTWRLSDDEIAYLHHRWSGDKNDFGYLCLQDRLHVIGALEEGKEAGVFVPTAFYTSLINAYHLRQRFARFHHANRV